MESVLNLAVPGKFCVPWERIARGCLLLVMLGILYISVQAHTKDLAEELTVNVVRIENKKGTAEIAVETPFIFPIADRPSGILPYNLSINSSVTALPAISKNNVQVVIPTVEKNIPIIIGGNVPITDNKESGTSTSIMDNIAADNVEMIPPVIREEKTGLDKNDTVMERDKTDISINAPVTDTPITDEPAINEPATDEPVINEPATDEPAADESATDNPVTDTPITDEPVTDEPTADEEQSGSEDIALREFSGFWVDGEGYITGVTENIDIADGLLVVAWDAECIGIRAGALSELTGCLDEIYIPANICEIESGVFDDFSYAYIEVAEDNPYFYSENGVLYSR